MILTKQKKKKKKKALLEILKLEFFFSNNNFKDNAAMRDLEFEIQRLDFNSIILYLIT